MTKPFDIGEFEEFCRSKPEGEAYNYCDPCGCALSQFLIASGLAKDPQVGAFEWCDGRENVGKNENPIPDKLQGALVRIPETFGALADRLAKLEK